MPHLNRPETLRNVELPTFPQSMIKFGYFLVGNHRRIWFWIWGKEFWPIWKMVVFWSFLPFFWRYGSKNAPVLHFWCWLFIFLHYDTDFWKKKKLFFFKSVICHFWPKFGQIWHFWPKFGLYEARVGQVLFFPYSPTLGWREIKFQKFYRKSGWNISAMVC